MSQSSLELRRPFAKTPQRNSLAECRIRARLGESAALDRLHQPSLIALGASRLHATQRCVAEQRRAHELEVYLPSARNENDARRKVDVCLALWQVKNPGVEALIRTAQAA